MKQLFFSKHNDEEFGPSVWRRQSEGDANIRKKDDFYFNLCQLSKKLPSFRKIENYYTNIYGMSFVKIKLKGITTSLDEMLISKFLEQNPRDNWTITIEINLLNCTSYSKTRRSR